MPGIDVLIKETVTLEHLSEIVADITGLRSEDIYHCESDEEILKCPKETKLILLLRKPKGDFETLIEFWPRTQDLDVMSLEFIKKLAKKSQLKCLIGDENRGPNYFKYIDKNGRVKPAKLDLELLKQRIFKTAS